MRLTADQARAIAKEVYIYGFPLVDSYRVQYAYFVDSHDHLIRAEQRFNLARHGNSASGGQR